MLRPQHVEQKQPYVDDSCKLLLHFNGISGNQQFIDSSNSPKVVTAYGNAVLSNTHYRFEGTSGYFDETGDYLSVEYSTDFDLGGDNWTIVIWYNPTTKTDFDTLLMRKINGVSYPAYKFDIGDGNYLPRFTALNSSGTTIASYAATSPVTFTNGSWYQIVWMRDGTNISLYINGNNIPLTVPVSIGSGSLISSTDPLIIGTDIINSDRDINGYIDECIFWKGIAKPIGELYPQLRPYGYPIGGT